MFYHELHEMTKQMKVYPFVELHKLSSVKNGIYLLFEEGEEYNIYNRIVRVGSHPINNGFFERISKHKQGNHCNSVFRKHIGRCLLNKEKDSYLSVWEEKKGFNGFKDQQKEYQIESSISKYLNKFSIAAIPNLNNAKLRMSLEAKLIATLNTESYKNISDNWLGKYHPDKKIVTSGLWNIQHLNNLEKINEIDLEILSRKLK